MQVDVTVLNISDFVLFRGGVLLCNLPDLNPHMQPQLASNSECSSLSFSFLNLALILKLLKRITKDFARICILRTNISTFIGSWIQKLWPVWLALVETVLPLDCHMWDYCMFVVSA